MLIPYRVKNPVRTIPLATYTLVVLNVLVFGLTTGRDLTITDRVVRDWAFVGGHEWFLRSFASQFLHGDLLHLIFNMYFLWLFGPAVEERLGHSRFLGLYFGAGLAGDLLHWASSGANTIPLIGASGAIMGILGSYWWLFTWSRVRVLFLIFFFLPYLRVFEIPALWLILFYVAMDFLGIAGPAPGDFVAHFAHIGGMLFGLVFPQVMAVRRDPEAVSQIKVLQADGVDLNEMSVSALETLLEHTPDDPALFSALVTAAVRENRPEKVAAAFRNAPEKFIQECPAAVSTMLLELKRYPRLLLPVHYLQLAGRLGATGQYYAQTQILQLLLGVYPRAPECETALLRLARLYLEQWKDPKAARMYLDALISRAPYGALADEARIMLSRTAGG